MRVSAVAVSAAILGAITIFSSVAVSLSRPAAGRSAPGGPPPTGLTIDYPLEGSVFPPEITPPTFLFRDSSDATRWVVRVTFGDHSPEIQFDIPGEHFRIGEIDPRASTPDEILDLTPQQKATRIWKPDHDTWTAIKRRSVHSRATVSISGFTSGDTKQSASTGNVNISTSSDPVGAPVFYRDVPLMLSPPNEKGAIQPLPNTALPLIKWRLRYIGEPQSRVVMENLPTCANCHSFSLDGKTLGLDMDGPRNDKGLYALVPISKDITIRNQDVIRWSSFQENLDASAVKAKSSEPAVKRFGIMSQVSPNGRYVVTSIAPPRAAATQRKDEFNFVSGLSDRLFSMNYRSIAFTQVFYPTRGILAWYDRAAEKLRPLPGASDPHYVQAGAFWSPDGKYIVFSRAEARDPYPPGAPRPTYANDPNETLIQYDLYRVPFKEGRGGKPEAVPGASHNGMSNNFPKVSPDGRWIVFVQNRSGFLMRPDSKLYIIPSVGGKPRLMKCNTSLMNSWHTFSPNGRWLAFSSKSRSPYTQLFLTHIDANGNDTPAILVENTTAANRGVNIPEFLNIAPGGLEKINPQATEFYGLFNQAWALMEKNQMAEAIPVLRQAIERDPNEALAHYALATALSGNNQEREALDQYRRACELDATNATWLDHYAVSLALNGDLDNAIVTWRKSLALDPSNASTETDLGAALFEKGQTQEGYEHLRKAVDLAPNFADAHNHLGSALAKTGHLDEAVEQLQAAITLLPNSPEYRFNLGDALMQRGDYAGAVTAFQKSVELSNGKNPQCLAALADAYDKAGQSAQAVQSARQALELAEQQHDIELQKTLLINLSRYEQESGAAHHE
jgi:tetratricopeptide (TPR) repeat protein